MINPKSRFQLFLSRKIKRTEAKYCLLAMMVFALMCVAMTLDYNDQAEIKAARTCANAVFAFDNNKRCDK